MSSFFENPKAEACDIGIGDFYVTCSRVILKSSLLKNFVIVHTDVLMDAREGINIFPCFCPMGVLMQPDPGRARSQAAFGRIYVVVDESELISPEGACECFYFYSSVCI